MYLIVFLLNYGRRMPPIIVDPHVSELASIITMNVGEDISVTRLVLSSPPSTVIIDIQNGEYITKVIRVRHVDMMTR